MLPSITCAPHLELRNNGVRASNAYLLDKGEREKFLPRRMDMDNIEKIDNVTWYGHCVIHLVAALHDLPDQAKLALCRDLEKFIKRQHRALRDAAV
jgi:hypothetical protein